MSILYRYLVPDSWTKADGGALDLFESVGAGSPDCRPVPGEVVRSIVPSFNSFVFFEVTPKSFHQVAEVLTRDKTRISVGGWFRGKSVAFPSRAPPPVIPMQKPCDISEDDFFEWINPSYLDPLTQAEIQESFGQSSEIWYVSVREI